MIMDPFLILKAAILGVGGLTAKKLGLKLPETVLPIAVATLAAWFSVVLLLRYVQTRDFVPFAWYRIVLGGALLALMALNIVK